MEAMTELSPGKYNRWEEVPLVLGTRDVAEILQVHSNTVVQLAESGKLKSFKVGRLLRFNRRDVMRYAGIPDGKKEDE